MRRLGVLALTVAALAIAEIAVLIVVAARIGVGWTLLVALLLGISPGTTFLGMDANTAKIATIILIGALMIIYVTVGGMKGTTYVQIVKAFMLMIGAALMTVLVLWHYKFNLSSLLGDAAAQSGKGEAFLEPGLVPVSQWRPDPNPFGEPEAVDAYGAVGRKP